eukprot:COSAG02_NODE_35377_length_469_cov_0.937838_1_plen_148_part_10
MRCKSESLPCVAELNFLVECSRLRVFLQVLDVALVAEWPPLHLPASLPRPLASIVYRETLPRNGKMREDRLFARVPPVLPDERQPTQRRASFQHFCIPRALWIDRPCTRLVSQNIAGAPDYYCAVVQGPRLDPHARNLRFRLFHPIHL